MQMPIKRVIYAVGCSAELVSQMRKIADNICGIRDTQWHVSDAPANEMRGCCVILSGSDHMQAVSQWTSDTEVLWIAEKPDMTVLRQGVVDALALPLDEQRFAASFSNMVCRCDRKRLIDIREYELKTYYEISDNMLWTKDSADLHMEVNHILIGLAGKSREQIEGKHENEVYGLAPGEAGCRQSDLYVRTTGKVNTFEESVPGADGRLHHLLVTKAPWLDGQGRIIGSIGLAKDVTELKNQQTKYDWFLDNLELGVVVVDNDGIILQANQLYLDIVGITGEEAVGHNIRGITRRKYEKSTEFGAEDYIIASPDGQKTIWTRNQYDLKDYWGKRYGYTNVFRDVTREREQQKKIIHMAVTDQLTGLANRTGMYEYFDAMDKSGAASFLFIDIDNFKLVNDEFGHNIGDRLLADVASLFSNILPDSFTARMGGDEFVTVVDGSVELKELEQKVEMLLKGIKKLPDYPQAILTLVSFSIGILYRYPLSEGFSAIIRRSDEGMYQAKRTGKNKYCVYNPYEFRKLQQEDDED